MQPKLVRERERSGFYLYSFAPASGIGFYLTKDGVFKFDLVTKEQLQLEGTALVAQRAEFDQVDADAYFTSYDELVSFTSTEYLRDKKNTLYSLLFTQDLGKELNSKTLRLLNESGFREVKFSERAIPIFGEIADRQRVSSVVQLAYDLGLKDVQRCLSNELPTLTFDFVRETIEEAQQKDLARERPSVFGETLELLRDYVSAVRTVPGFAYQSIMAFCDYAERNVPSLSTKGVDALSSLLTSFERSSPMVEYAKAIAFNNPRLIAETFTSALFQSEADTVTALSSRLNEISFARDDELMAVGRSFLESGVRWVVPDFLPWSSLIEIYPEQGESTRESIRSVAREVYLRHRDQTKFNRTRSNLQFSIDFVLTARLFSAIENLPWYADNLSFWIAFYAEPDWVYERLYRFRLFPYLFEELFYYMHRYSDLEESEQFLFYAYNASNLCALALMHLDVHETGDIVSRFVYESRYEFPRDLKPSHPLVLMLSNILAWALQTRQHELVNRITAYLSRVGHEKSMMSPFIRVIL